MDQLQQLPAEIAAAIIDAQSKARAVGKDAKNKFHGYKYASAEAMIEEGRGALIDAGLGLLTLGWELDASDPKASSVEGSKCSIVGRIVVNYRLVHKGGAFVDFKASTPVVPEKGRPEDKAEMAALTANLGYVIRGLLMLPREDGDGVEQRDDRNYEPRQPRPQSQPATQPAGGEPANDPAHPALCDDLVARINAAPDLSSFGELNASIKKAAFPKALADRAWSAFFRKGFAFASDVGELEEWGLLVVDAKLADPELGIVRAAYDARFTALESSKAAA